METYSMHLVYVSKYGSKSDSMKVAEKHNPDIWIMFFCYLHAVGF